MALGECIEWPNAVSAQGYGVKRIGGKVVSMHRKTYSDAHGPIPEGMVVRHKCDNRRCIRLDHLEIGTYADNANDCSRRNRHHNKKLSDEDVIEVKRLLGTTTGRAIAKRFGVSEHLISKIKLGLHRRKG